MLNKDQYNQEEYNDYYRQESGGAEVDENEGGMMKKLIILLVILGLAIAGYFGYKAMNDAASEEIDTSLQVSAESSLPQSVQEVKEAPQELAIVEEVEELNETEKVSSIESVARVESVAKVESVETNNDVDTEQVTAITKEIIKQSGETSPDKLAAVVAVVMQQMEEQKTAKGTEDTAVTSPKDSALMNELEQSDVDSVSADLVKELENMKISENTQVNDNQKQVDVYNKVNVQNVSGKDQLSTLSDQIGEETEEKVTSKKVDDYTQALKTEVDVRKSEMRIIVVKKGDTLGKIAKRAYGNVMDFKKISKANPELTRPDRIYIGQKLRIPNE